ncbi:MAG: tetratricopeptide repeat protein [Chloroflexi bacterium]|nr:MAG: tetratricopeptide repeat protein [Chloroflexota bacterium]
MSKGFLFFLSCFAQHAVTHSKARRLLACAVAARRWSADWRPCATQTIKVRASIFWRRWHKVAALLLLAHNYWLQDDLSAATDWLQQVLILAPEQAYAHALLGSVLLARRQFAAARECLDVALSLAPDDMRVRISRAEYFYQSERYAETIGELGHALRLPAPSPAVRAYARDLLRAAQAKERMVRQAEPW